MSTLVIQGENSHARERRRINPLNRFFGGLVAFLCFVLVLELVYHFVLTPRLRISQIEVRTDPDFPLTDDELIRVAGLEQGGTFFRIDAAEIERRLESAACVRSASVVKMFPDTVRIVLKKRKPLLMSLVTRDGELVPVAIDVEGVVFEHGRTVLGYDVPVISGVSFPEIRPGMRLPERLLSFLEDIAALKEENPTLFNLISEIKFVKKDTTDYEILLYPSRNPIRIRIGPELTEQQLKYYLMVLDVAVKHGISETFAELDFRTGEAVYRVGEE